MTVLDESAGVTATGAAPPVVEPEGLGLVTVVVPCLDEAASIGRCLRSILAQTHRRLEVLVIDGGSCDGTLAAIGALDDARVRLLHNPRRSAAAAMNLAVSAMSGEWLVRVDAHATIPPDYVERIVAHLGTGRWGGVGGRKDGTATSTRGRAVARAMSSRIGVGGSRYHYETRRRSVDHVPFGAYPRAVVDAIGGWDESLSANEDFEFDYRVGLAGHLLLLDPEVRIQWRCQTSIAGLSRQYRRYGRGKARVVRLHPGSVRPSHLAAPLLVAWTGGAALLALTGSRRAALRMTAPYAVAVWLGAVALTRAEHREDDPTAPSVWEVAAALVAMHFSWGIGFWEGAWSELTGSTECAR